MPQVFITGLGPVSSLGCGKRDFWTGILNKNINLKKEKHFFDDGNEECFYNYKIKEFGSELLKLKNCDLKETRAWKEGFVPVDFEYLISAIDLAFHDSKLKGLRGKSRIGLVLFHENLGFGAFYNKFFDLITKYQNQLRGKLSKEEIVKFFYNDLKKAAYDLQTFTTLFHVQRLFDLHDFSLFINNACCSGLYAIEVAADMIRTKKCDCVVVAGSDAVDIYKYLWFKELGIYSPDGFLRPFSLNRNGLVIGEGAAAIVLEESTHAIKRGANIYAEYSGGWFSSESWKMNFPAVGQNYYADTIKKCIEVSGLKKEEIDIVCSHGTGTKVFDEYEARAMINVFGKNFQKPFVSAFKSYIGHTLGISALIETIILLLAMQKHVIPETLFFDEKDKKNNIPIIQKTLQVETRHALKICSSFAGFDGACMFKRVNT